MHHRRGSLLAPLLLTCIPATLLMMPTSAVGQTEHVLYAFTGANSNNPNGNLIFDTTGNLYGMTNGGGVYKGGEVYEVSPQTGEEWSESDIYDFSGGINGDGDGPDAGLVSDTAGNLYGTTAGGGTYFLGTAFELSPASGGGWTKRTIYDFGGISGDAANPASALVFDSSGNLYGTCARVGSQYFGGVFKLSPNVGGGWTDTVLLTGTFTHGWLLNGPVVFDGSGNLYATAASGGTAGGAIYQLHPKSGVWEAAAIYTFQGGADGMEPMGGLAFRAPNHFFGVTDEGGGFGGGTAFELTKGAGGVWSKSTIYNFGSSPTDALYPSFSLTLGRSGQLYGTTNSGGSFGYGTAFELAQIGHAWAERILHNFTLGADAGNPAGGVVSDSTGNLYGQGRNGGSAGAGAVYEIVP